jgi:hypothetical protein
MALTTSAPSERLVKSMTRVRDLGEVFTPNATVQAMLDLLPDSVWASHPSSTFLEPACGDGNFLVAILDRKLDRITADSRHGTLIGGCKSRPLRFHALEALASIYAVDISVENVIGGTPGHEVGARERLLDLLAVWDAEVGLGDDAERAQLLEAGRWIVNHNIIIGNMRPITAAGTPTGRDAIPLIEYEWEPQDLSVELRKTTMGDVLAAARTDSAGTLGLFATAPAPSIWQGDALRLSEAARIKAPIPVGPARNGMRAVVE